MNDLQQTILITGATSGFGKETAKIFNLIKIKYEKNYIIYNNYFFKLFLFPK